MGGGGEGVVVLGVTDAVAVMLLDRRPHDLDYRSRLPLDTSAYPAIPSRLNKSVDTRTGQKSDVGAQIGQDTYTSTYQLAHCNVSPSFPPIRLQEFPPQRPEPCRTQGNFEVGGVGSEEYHRSRSPSPTESLSLRAHWPDRGLASKMVVAIRTNLHKVLPPANYLMDLMRSRIAPLYQPRSPYSIRHQNRRDSAAFVKSLRKYPSFPERSPSAELVQLLIKQTQEKYFSKTSHYTRSMRNFCDKQIPEPDNIKKPSKDIQSPGRSKKDEVQKDTWVKQSYETRHSKTKPKSFRSGYKSPMPECTREIRARDTFDYLNNSIPKPPPGVACGDRRAVKPRDSLRQVFGDRDPVAAFPVCPTMRSRYERHKKEHHTVCAKQSEADKSNVVHEPVSVLAPKPWQFCGLPVALTSFCPEVVPKCCRCHKPLPCACLPEDEAEEKRKLEDIVCAWLEKLPVCAKENPHDKFIRDAVIKKLIDTISLIKDNEFDDKGKEIIKLSIARMPMWLPDDEKDREAFKNKIADDLFNQIKSFRLRDRFKDNIVKWLDTINFDDEKIDKGKVASDFSKALKEIALNRPSNDSVYREMLKSKAFDLLADLPVQSSLLKNDILNLLSDKLADQLVRLPKETIKPDTQPTVTNEIETILMDSFKNNPVIDGLSEDVKQKAAKKLVPMLKNILLNENDKITGEKMHGELRNWLSNFVKEEGVQIDDKDQESFIDVLANKLNASQVSEKLEQEERAGELVQPLLDWLSGLPGAPDSNKPENRKMIEELANEIQRSQQSGDETEVIRRVGSWLRNSGKKAGVDIRPGSEEEFAKKILPKISQLNKSRKRWSKNSQSTRFLNLTSDDPQLKQALMDKIQDVINQSHANVTNRDDVESKLHDVLADLVMRGTDDSNAKDQILSILENSNVSSEEANNISEKLIARANEMSRSLRSNEISSGFISPDRPITTTSARQQDKPSATSTPQKQSIKKSDEEKKYHEDLNSQIHDWINKQNLPIETSEKVAIAQDLANDLLDRQKYLQLKPEAKTSEKEEFEHLKYQLFKRLNRHVDSAILNTLMSKVDSLMNIIKQNPVPVLVKKQLDQDFKEDRLMLDSNEFVQENLEGGILDWLRKSSISQQFDEKDKTMLERLVPVLAKSLTSTISSISTTKSEPEADEILLNVIIEHLKKSLQSKKRSNEYVRKKAENLLKHLKDLQLFQNISVREDRAAEKSHMHQINEEVRKWCNDLELPDTEKAERIKEDLSNKMMLKIGELNMNPHILNDDILYEHMLSDFIDQELSKLPIDQSKTEKVKAGLMKKVNEERLKVKHDYAGQAYKQQLRDTISKALPSMENPPASFEVMKDNLADDFINLHSAGDEALKSKYKNKIKDQIAKFTEDYTKRYPDTPFSTDQLNRDLYDALKKVEIPNDDSMRSEVEQARIKDLIKDYLDEPLQKMSSTEKLHANKILTVMSKRLHDMEKENEANPDENYDEKQRHEIEKYLQKIPLKENVDISKTADKILEDMKNTKHTRTFTGTKRTSTSAVQKETPLRHSSSLSPHASWPPPSSLSLEDQEHLQGIRKRAQPCKIALQSGKCCCKPTGNVFARDAAVNPPPLDTGSQTDMVKENQYSQCTCPKAEANTSDHRTPCQSRSQIISKPCTMQRKRVSTGTQIEISPYVVIKEYFWDANPPEVRCPNTPVERPSRSCLSSAYTAPPNKHGTQACMTPEQTCAMPHRSMGTCTEPNRPQYTRLGSFDDNEHLESFGQPTPRRQYGRPLTEESEWNTFSRNEHHGPRQHFYRDKGQVEPERHNVKCGCKTKVFKCRGRKPVFCQTCRDDPMKFCAKCCGAQCPFPAKFYFR